MPSSAARCSILQPKDGYRAGVDAVLLAAAAPVKAGAGERVLDVGAGVGVVGLAVARRVADAAVAAGGTRGRARRARPRQHRAQRSCRARARDRGRRVAAARATCRSSPPWPKASITCWPTRPYNAEGAARPRSMRSRPRPTSCRAAASPAGRAFMAAMARPGGTATMIHVPMRWARSLLAACAGRFGGTVVLPAPSAGRRVGDPRARAGHQGQQRAARAAARARPARRRQQVPPGGRGGAAPWRRAEARGD